MKPRRILCIGENWLGSDARAAFMAFRRLGHSVHVIDEWHYVPLAWRSVPARAIRKAFRPLFVRELQADAERVMDRFRPDLLFVFKGAWVHPDVLRAAAARGIATANYYPDVSFMAHGSNIPAALPLYDHVFTTKTYGIEDMRRTLGVERSSFLAPGFDPEVHRPLELSPEDAAHYGCDATFIGTWSPKKEALLAALRAGAPEARLKIWGCQWEAARERRPEFAPCIMGDEVIGDEYARAIQGAKINLGILSEVRAGASSGDLITARTFQIPACGAFMLHERNPEAERYFTEGVDAGFFDAGDLPERVKAWLANDAARARAAAAGLARSARDGYSIDAKMTTVLNWLDIFRAGDPVPAGTPTRAGAGS